MRNTTNEAIPFEYGQHSIEVLVENGVPLFVAADVCKVLGLDNVNMAVARLDDDEKLTSKVLRSGQLRQIWLVNEGGLYHLIFNSTKPNAKAFRKWVTSEVLPAIRKTGKYEAAAPTAAPLADGSVQLKADLAALFELGGHGAKGRLCEALLESGAINRTYIQEFLDGKRQLTLKQAEKLHQRVSYLLTIHRNIGDVGRAWLPLLERFTPSELMGYAYGQKKGFYTPDEPLLTALFTAAQELNERLLMVSPSKNALA